jgi:hypothetical protein
LPVVKKVAIGKVTVRSVEQKCKPVHLKAATNLVDFDIVDP